jgi:drug/metabolite transporter (DMT)-like permease
MVGVATLVEAIPPVVFLVVMVLSAGASTVFLRLAIVQDGRVDEARFHRALFQTVLVVGGVGLLLAGRLANGPIPAVSGMTYAALNGAFGGIAFILFTRGLETEEASRAKPALVVGMAVPVTLGIVLLGEVATLRKAAGVVLAAIAVYLLAGN